MMSLVFKTRFLRRGGIAVALALLAGSAGSATARAQKYTLTDLGLMGAPPGQPFHMANDGFIAGGITVSSGSEHAILWFGTQSLDLSSPGLGGTNSMAFGVNNRAQLTGEADTAVPDPNGEDFCGFATLLGQPRNTCLPVVWPAGRMMALPTLRNQNGQHGSNGTAESINASGGIAGVSENATPDPTCAPYNPAIGQNQSMQEKPVVWSDGKVQELPTIPGDTDGIALGISDSGVAAGVTGNCAPFDPILLFNLTYAHAVVWEKGKAIDLGNLGGVMNNMALGVNNSGDAAGQSDVSGDVTTHAFLWTHAKKTMEDLAPLGSDVFSVGVGLNDSRQVVGLSGDASGNIRAILWRKGAPVDLNTQVPGNASLYLLTACSIDDDGQIIGQAIDGSGNVHGYLLSPRGNGDGDDSKPVPLPEWVRAKIRGHFHH